jgi:hypothetical protein
MGEIFFGDTNSGIFKGNLNLTTLCHGRF